jgi:phosphatidylserine/phosphatidylglycerophosphate/cardiolipin synthase-like enzyme
MFALRQLSHAALLRVAEALESGRLAPPFRSVKLEPYMPGSLIESAARSLDELCAGTAMTPAQLARLVRILAEERAASQAAADRIQLVWSGIEIKDGTRSRDTGSVVQEMFGAARKSVLIASYVLDSGHKARAIFGALARRMDEDPGLAVRLCLNVKREWRDERTDAELLREFAERFRDRTWPGKRWPEVYYDPRALTVGGDTRACLHAKCIVVDEQHVFMSSANFTEAAHARNIEAGVRLDDRQIAQALRIQFDTLIERRLLCRVPGLSNSERSSGS